MRHPLVASLLSDTTSFAVALEPGDLAPSAIAPSLGGDAGVGVLEPPPRPAPEQRRRVRRPAPGGGGGGPPEGGDGGDGGGDGDEGDEGDEGGAPDERPAGAAAFGLGLALAAIVTLFVVFLAAFLVLRGNAPQWPPPEAPAPTLGLWTSTLLLLLSSATMAAAVAAARRGERGRAARRVAATLGLGLLFLGAQARLWTDFFERGFFPSSSGYGATFFALTGLHAAHVVGGLVYLTVLCFRLNRGAPPAEERHASRLPPERVVPLCAVYWHFMGGIWVALLTALWA